MAPVKRLESAPDFYPFTCSPNSNAQTESSEVHFRGEECLATIPHCRTSPRDGIFDPRVRPDRIELGSGQNQIRSFESYIESGAAQYRRVARGGDYGVSAAQSGFFADRGRISASHQYTVSTAERGGANAGRQLSARTAAQAGIAPRYGEGIDGDSPIELPGSGAQPAVQLAQRVCRGAASQSRVAERAREPGLLGPGTGSEPDSFSGGRHGASGFGPAGVAAGAVRIRSGDGDGE